MCGIVGIINFSSYGIGYQDRDLFQKMLTVGVLRGSDGTGAIIVDEDGVARSLKIGAPPDNFFSDPAFKPFFELNMTYKAGDPIDRALIGHNRATSVGVSNTTNAHPHKVGPITLVHNGTLREYSKLPKMAESDVDSYALCDAIAELGVDKAIGLSHGSYAIVYHDARDGSINFLRNSERPLAFAVDNALRKVFFASERLMLQWLLERDGSTGFQYSALLPDTLVSYKPDSFTPTIREVKGPPITSFYTHVDVYSEIEHDVLLPVIDNYYNASRKALSLPAPKAVEPEDSKKTVEKDVPKHVRRVLKKVGDLGTTTQILEQFYGFRRGDPITFKLRDYMDANPSKEKFTVCGENPDFPNTIFKFHVIGGSVLDKLFEAPTLPGQAAPSFVGKVKHMLHYPEAADDEEKFHVWVIDPRSFVESEKSETVQ